MPRIPIFPLRTVLVPGSRLPLRIFEPRYVAMVESLVRAGGPPRFGVVAIRRGNEVGTEAQLQVFDVGCLAQITRLEAGAPGTAAAYHVDTVGTRRFRIDLADGAVGMPRRPSEPPSVRQSSGGPADSFGGQPFPTAVVEFLDEPQGGSPPEVRRAAETLREALDGYRRALGGPVALAADPARLSYQVADLLGVDVTERQQILAAPSTLDRLRRGRALVHRERSLWGTLRAVTRPLPPEPPARN